jgi:hypothetical protein
MQRFYSAIDRFGYVANSKKQTPEILTNNYLNKIKQFLINDDN